MKNMSLTKKLLLCSALAGPIYIIVGLSHALLREGFDMTRHPLSMLSLGEFGWIQIINFLLTGTLVVLGAFGLRQVAGGDKRWKRAALFAGLFGVGVICGGLFVTDPALGFPPGTPDAYLATPSWHSMLHMLLGQLGFLMLIIATFIQARYFASAKQHGWSVYSIFTGVFFLAAIIAVGSSMGAAWANLTLYAAIGMAWMWLTAISVYALRYKMKKA